MARFAAQLFTNCCSGKEQANRKLISVWNENLGYDVMVEDLDENGDLIRGTAKQIGRFPYEDMAGLPALRKARKFMNETAEAYLLDERSGE